MGCTSVSGTGSAALTRGLRSGGMIRAAMLTAAVALLPGNSAPAQVHPAAIQLGAVDVRFEGLRSAKGMVRACLTANPKFFPHCEKDPASYKASVAAAPGAQLRFSGVKPGDYALTVLHDENENFRADMMLEIGRAHV